MKSGSLITARCALEQGRDLYVVPDHPSHLHSAGGLALLESGVAPLTQPAHLLEMMGLRPALEREPTGLIAQLADTPDVATLARRIDRPLREVQQALSALELTGQVERLAGGRYGALTDRSRRTR